MAFVLVKWVKEDSLSIISAAWVLQPSTIGDLPVDAMCYWKKRSNKLDAIILARSGMCFVKVQYNNYFSSS